MAPGGKIAEFRKEGNDWFCNSGLPSDVTVVVEGVHFHLHKFPLVSRCAKMVKEFEKSEERKGEILTILLEGFPGGPDIFLITAKFCYGLRIELTPRNIVVVYCAADYLEMADECDEDNLLSKCEAYFHKNVLHDWKSCLLALRSSETVISYAEKLQIVSKCSVAIATMVCTDPSLFGWPMMMYGSLQSPGGSILWNGINTGARMRSVEPDWWYEDISYLCVVLFERLIKTMEARGLRPERIVGAIMHYTRKYLPGLRRWQGGKSGATRTVTSFSMTPLTVDERALLESIVKLLPDKKGRCYCRFLLSLLRVAMILGVSQECKDSLERRIGLQLELVTLDGLLIPTYSDADTLYDTDCVQRIIRHFLSSDSTRILLFSPSSLEINGSPSSSEPLKQVAKLVDGYIAEVASDVNLKPDKLRALMQALPEDSRSLHDGLYRALDIYFKEHPWLSDKEREELSNIMDFHKLSVDACAHASQNDRLPLRIVLQVLFFEQLHLRMAVAGCLHAMDPETAPVIPAIPNQVAGQIIQMNGWVTVVNENRGLKVDMDRMRSRVAELEQEFDKIKEEVKKVSKSVSSFSSPRLIIRRLGCRRLPRSSEVQADVVESTGPTTPKASTEQAQTSRPLRHTVRASPSFD